MATLFSVIFAALLLSMGEIDLTQTALMVVAGVISDAVRQIIGNNLKRGAFFAYPILAVGVIVWIMKLWIDSEWYYQGAAEEIGTDYAEGLRTLSSIWALLLVIALTLAVGFVGIRISAAKMKSSDRFS